MLQPSTASDSPIAAVCTAYGSVLSSAREHADAIRSATADSRATRARTETQVRPRPLATVLLMRRTRFRGTSRPAVVSALYCTPGTMTTLPLAASARQSRTTSSTSSHRNDGVPSISMPARSWNSVRTKPGHSACTPTPVPSRPFARPSLNETTHALDAEYVDPRPGSSPATLATLMTVPSPASSIGGSAAWVNCMTAVTLTSSWLCSTSRLAVQNSPEVPKPALLTTTRMPADNRSATL